LRGISVPKYDNVDDAREKLNQLSASDSPLVSVVKEAAKQTNLADASGGGLFAWIGSLFSSNQSKEGPGRSVDLEFTPLVQFISGNADSEYRKGLYDLQDRLYGKTPEQLKQEAKTVTDLTQATVKRLEPLNAKLGSHEAYALLKQPLDRFNEMLSLANYEE